MDLLWIVLAVVVTLFASKVVRLVRVFPRGRRLRALKFVVPAVLNLQFAPSSLPLEQSDFRAHDEPPTARRTVPVSEWATNEDLVQEPRLVARAQSVEIAWDVDHDGTVVVARAKRDPGNRQVGYALALRTIDGGRTTIFDSANHTDEAAIGVSIQRGAVSWWSLPADRQTATLWRWDVAKGARALAREPTPVSDPMWFTKGGTLIMGDTVAWTLVGRGFGRVGVTNTLGESAHLGRTHFLTLHRDLVAEEKGQEVAACAISPGSDPVDYQVTALQIATDGPRVRFLRRGLFPGASLAEETTVGFRRHDHTLELPGGLAVPIDDDALVSDVVANRVWAAFAALYPPRRNEYVMHTWVLHLESGMRHELLDGRFMPPRIRGEWILWSTGPRERVGAAITERGYDGWLGRLNSPQRARLVE